VWDLQLTRAIRRYRFGYVFGVVLCVVSCMVFVFVVWRGWSVISGNANPLSVFWDFLWAEEIALVPSVEIKLMYVVVLAGGLMFLGVGVIAFSRQWFFLPGKTMKLQCPFCKKFWRAGYNSGQVLCPHCRHLVHPKIAEE